MFSTVKNDKKSKRENKLAAMKAMAILAATNMYTKPSEDEAAKSEKGLTTVELIIILAVIGGFGVLWKLLGDEIKTIFMKLIDFIKGLGSLF